MGCTVNALCSCRGEEWWQGRARGKEAAGEAGGRAGGNVCPNVVFFPEIAITQMRCWLEQRCVLVRAGVCVRVLCVHHTSCKLRPYALGLSQPPTCSPLSRSVVHCPKHKNRHLHLQESPPANQCSMTTLLSLPSINDSFRKLNASLAHLYNQQKDFL